MQLHACKLFPEPKEVFSKQVKEHRAVLLPYMIMPLHLIVPGSKIRVPWVIPHEPYEGAVGDQTKKYHTFFSRENWIGFHLESGKMRFDSDLSYFLKHQIDHLPSNQRSFPQYEGTEKECLDSHQKIEKRYEQRLKNFRKRKSKKLSEFDIFDKLGGVPDGGNWASTQKKPYFNVRSSYPQPIDEKGRPLIYLGTIRPKINHADEMIGFINADLNHVVFTFDFS
jgi:hypothetical protein